MRILLIGGAGVTGTVIARTLLARGAQVTILHRGRHAADLPESVERIIADPYALESLEQALAGRQFDAALVMYGRLRFALQALQGKTTRVISIGGAAPVYRGWGEMTSPNPWETTQPTPLFLAEDHPLATAETADRFSIAVRKTEADVMTAHQRGDFVATHFRYPLVYGPNNLCPAEWGLIRRAREGRHTLILPGGGLTMVSRGYSENIAHAILLALDNPQASAGQIYNVCDDSVLYNQQWVTLLSDMLQHPFDCIDIPFAWLPAGFRATPPQLLYRHHCVMSTEKLRSQLGYRDVVSVEEALQRTIRWYSDHPLQPGCEAECNLGDPFDYAYEDAFIAGYQQQYKHFTEHCAAIPAAQVLWKHPYQQ